MEMEKNDTHDVKKRRYISMSMCYICVICYCVSRIIYVCARDDFSTEKRLLAKQLYKINKATDRV